MLWFWQFLGLWGRCCRWWRDGFTGAGRGGMIRGRATNDGTGTSIGRWARGGRKPLRAGLLLILSCGVVCVCGTGCRVLEYGHLRIVKDTEVETLVMEGQTLKAPFDGMFISVSRYREYRQAVADRISELESR